MLQNWALEIYKACGYLFLSVATGSVQAGVCRTLCKCVSSCNAHSFWWGLTVPAQRNANEVNVDWIQTVNYQPHLLLISQGHKINFVKNNWSENNSNKLLACELNKILPLNLKIIDCNFLSTEKLISFEL